MESLCARAVVPPAAITAAAASTNALRICTKDRRIWELDDSNVNADRLQMRFLTASRSLPPQFGPAVWKRRAQPLGPRSLPVEPRQTRRRLPALGNNHPLHLTAARRRDPTLHDRQ